VRDEGEAPPASARADVEASIAAAAGATVARAHLYTEDSDDDNDDESVAPRRLEGLKTTGLDEEEEGTDSPGLHTQPSARTPKVKQSITNESEQPAPKKSKFYKGPEDVKQEPTSDDDDDDDDETKSMAGMSGPYKYKPPPRPQAQPPVDVYTLNGKNDDDYSAVSCGGGSYDF